MSRIFQVLISVCVISIFGCGAPADDTPLGRECAAVLARPEKQVDEVKVQHVLIAFVGAMRGSESKRNFAEARALAEDVFKRARGGEDFTSLMKTYSSDDGGGTYTLTQANRGDYAHDFHAIAFRLAVGEIGVAVYDADTSPFGWHVIKRLE
jgi:parvulin-like peptidyl-prolyl isomerase